MKKRRWVYVQSPKEYDIASCSCGNVETQWSEWQGHLWCAKCEKDFVPEHNGIFDGPIPVNAAAMLGLCFDRYYLRSKRVFTASTVGKWYARDKSRLRVG